MRVGGLGVYQGKEYLREECGLRELERRGERLSH